MKKTQRLLIGVNLWLCLMIGITKPVLALEIGLDDQLVQSFLSQWQGLWLTGLILGISIVGSIWWGLKKRER